MNVYGLFRGKGTETFMRGAVETYATRHGFHNVTLIEAADAESLRAKLQDLGPGDAAIFYALGDIGDRPSEIHEEVRTLMARGVDVHVRTGVGQIGPVYNVLRQAWEHAEKIEKDLAKAVEDRKTDAEQWATLFEQFQRRVGSAIVERWGPMALRDFTGLDFPDAVVEKAPAPASANTAKVDYAAIGALIRQERQARHLTQKHLAEQLGHWYQTHGDPDARTPDVSAISRVEAGDHAGQGPHAKPLLELLAPDMLPGEEFDAIYPDDTWAVFTTARLKVRKARAEELSAAEFAEWEDIKAARDVRDFGTMTKLAEQVGHGAVNGVDITEPPGNAGLPADA